MVDHGFVGEPLGSLTLWPGLVLGPRLGHLVGGHEDAVVVVAVEIPWLHSIRY